MTSNFIEQFGFNDEEFADQEDVVEWVLTIHASLSISLYSPSLLGTRSRIVECRLGWHRLKYFLPVPRSVVKWFPDQLTQVVGLVPTLPFLFSKRLWAVLPASWQLCGVKLTFLFASDLPKGCKIIKAITCLIVTGRRCAMARTVDVIESSVWPFVSCWTQMMTCRFSCIYYWENIVALAVWINGTMSLYL